MDENLGPMWRFACSAQKLAIPGRLRFARRRLGPVGSGGLGYRDPCRLAQLGWKGMCYPWVPAQQEQGPVMVAEFLYVPVVWEELEVGRMSPFFCVGCFVPFELEDGFLSCSCCVSLCWLVSLL